MVPCRFSMGSWLGIGDSIPNAKDNGLTNLYIELILQTKDPKRTKKTLGKHLLLIYIHVGNAFANLYTYIKLTSDFLKNPNLANGQIFFGAVY